MPKKTIGRYQALRTQIEFNAPAPAVILVTSATVNDGSTIAAIGLADCLGSAGHRVALVATSLEGTMEVERHFALHSLSEKLGTRRDISDNVAAFIDSSRSEFDYTIVEAPPILESRVSLAFAGAVEAVVLSIRLGRMRCPEDDLMMQALERAQARVLGVVGASEASIRELDATGRTAAQRDEYATRPQPRKAKSSIVTVP